MIYNFHRDLFLFCCRPFLDLILFLFAQWPDLGNDSSGVCCVECIDIFQTALDGSGTNPKHIVNLSIGRFQMLLRFFQHTAHLLELFLYGSQYFPYFARITLYGQCAESHL